MSRRGPFEVGEPCLILDARDRHHLVSLTRGRTFQFDRGAVPHDTIIGVEEGSTIRSSNGSPLVVVRPRLTDYVLAMKRGAAIMSPKDTAAMVTWADVGPGMRVLEAGTGSGALTLALGRAVGAEGLVVTVERRDDHARHAKRLVEEFLGGLPTNIDFREGDVTEVVADVDPDRIVLDVPEPWHVVAPAAEHLRGGGMFACYLPTVPQVQTVREALDASGVFFGTETFEVLMRGWAIDGRSVRPEHRMVGHTGFITVSRKRLRVTDDPTDGAA